MHGMYLRHTTRRKDGKTHVATCDFEFVKQARRTHVNHRQSLSACLIAERTGEPGLAAAGGAGEQQMLMLANPVAAGETRHQAFVQAASCAVINILDTRAGVLEPGLLEQPFQSLVVAVGTFPINQ